MMAYGVIKLKHGVINDHSLALKHMNLNISNLDRGFVSFIGVSGWNND